MRENMLSRRTIVYAILLVAVFLLLASVVSGCGTPEATTDDRGKPPVRDTQPVRDQDFFFGPDDGYWGATRPDTGKRIPSYPYGSFCSGGKCPHGRGKLGTDGGFIYIGDFQYGVMHGSGDYRDDTIEYVGAFRHGVPHGPGTLTCLDGTKYTGSFSDGRLVGQFRVTTGRGTLKSISFTGRDARSGPIVADRSGQHGANWGPCEG